MTQRDGQKESFELRSSSGCGGLTKEWVNRRSFRSRKNNKRKTTPFKNGKGPKKTQLQLLCKIFSGIASLSSWATLGPTVTLATPEIMKKRPLLLPLSRLEEE